MVVLVVYMVAMVVVLVMCVAVVNGSSVCGYGSCDGVDSGVCVVIVTVCKVNIWGRIGQK